MTAVGLRHGRCQAHEPARSRLPEFQAVAEGVVGVETPHAWERSVVPNLDAGARKARPQLFEIVHDEAGMSFARRLERF